MTREVRLGKSGLIALVDDADWELVDQYYWNILRPGTAAIRNVPYVFGSSKDKTDPRRIHLSRLLMSPGEGMVVDHINGDTLDNRRANLRVCSRSQNNANRRHTSYRALPKGVSQQGTWADGAPRYVAIIGKDRKQYRLGTFRCWEEAGRAYDKKAIEFFGEFALLNYPPDGPGFVPSTEIAPWLRTPEEA